MQPAVDAYAVAAAQVANQNTVVGHRHATMSSRNLRRIDADVTVRVPADQEDRPLQGDRSGRFP